MPATYSTTSPLLRELLASGFVRANADGTGFVLPDGSAYIGNSGVAKSVATDQASPSAVGAGVKYAAFLGTLPASFTLNFPAGAAALDGFEVKVFLQAAVGTALTLASAGATFVGAPATTAANTVLRFIYNHATTQWLPA